MLVPKDDILRHKILAILLKDAIESNEQVITVEQSAITTVELAKQLNVSPEKIRQVTSLMQKDGIVKYDDFGKGECLYTWEHSATALYEKTYLRNGRKRINDSLYDVVKWVLPIALIVVAIATTYINVQLNKDRLKIQPQIDSLKQELNTLKYQESKESRNAKYHDSLSCIGKIISDSSKK